ncbi:MAG: hypothetical protein QOF23_827, partial [Solirubrobacterales bacterium]|nr:hypothetical protein [Solirubrobacterales bacterium]
PRKALTIGAVCKILQGEFDDVTDSRNHALLVRRRDGLYIDDLGSLNGTYLNRRRIESHRLADGDEIQVGKYKLSYLER